MGEENNQIVLIFLISGLFILALATILVLFLVIYQKRIVTQENKLQRIENEKQQILLRASIEGQERERSRLAKDLHDGIGSLLAGLNFNLKFLRSQLTPESEEALLLNNACSQVEEGIDDIRRVSHNLMPSSIENFGLIAALKESTELIRQTNKINVVIKETNLPSQLPHAIALGFLRIFQELTQNTIKHSGATQIIAEFNGINGTIEMRYSDNGIGLHDNWASNHGIGVRNMMSRVNLLKGNIDFHNEESKGFHCFVKIPYHQEKNDE